MVEPKGKLKFKKVDDLTIEVSDDDTTRVWTRETLEAAIAQIVFEEKRLDTRKGYYKTILDKALELGIKTSQEVENIEKEIESE